MSLTFRGIAVAFLFICAVAGFLSLYQPYSYTLEDIAFALDPTAERAYRYGVLHFDARVSEEYDIARAEYFLKKALVRDPSLPLVRHELARIEFLYGNLYSALPLIDEELRVNPEPSPSSYYVRALLKGYMQDYAGAAADYETYFAQTPANWGSINDYSWVLMQSHLSKAALAALSWGLKKWPENPWLLNNKATALYELKRYELAHKLVLLAAQSAENVTAEDWLAAYPGNDPLAAEEGIAFFRQAIAENKARIELALEDK